jgi:hypothetical protein
MRWELLHYLRILIYQDNILVAILRRLGSELHLRNFRIKYICLPKLNAVDLHDGTQFVSAIQWGSDTNCDCDIQK